MKKKVCATARAHVFYSGRVQGVGFRYTAEKLAMELDLTGWVKNLPDGRVEMVCEGPREKIELLLNHIRQCQLGSHIRRTDCLWESCKNEFDDFRVEFHY